MSSDLGTLGTTSVDVDVALGPLRKKLSEAKSMVDGDLAAGGEQAGRSMASRIVSSVGRGLAGLGKVIGAAAAAGAVGLAAVGVAGAKAGLETASAMEQADIAFSTMLGSAAAADDFLGDMAAFAAKTPFEFPELQTAASSLISAGVEAGKVIPIMTSLGNATSGMGTGSEGVKRATVALQQMSAAGRITGEDLNQLRDAGIPVFDLLSAATGKTKEEVAELAQKGKLGKTEMLQLFEALETGKGLERFNGLMEAQSNSLVGMMSTLRDNVGMGLSRVVEPWMPTIKQAVGIVAREAGVFFDWAAAKSGELAVHGPKLITAMEGAIARAKVVLGEAKAGLDALLGGFREGETGASGWLGVMQTVGVTMRGISDAAQAMWSQVNTGDSEASSAALASLADSAGRLGPVIGELIAQMPSFSDLLTVGATAIGWLADHADELAAAMPYIVAGLVAWKVAQMGANVAAAASVPLKIAEIAGNRQLAVANRTLAAAMTANTAARGANTTVTITNTTTTGANTAATQANAGAHTTHSTSVTVDTGATGANTGATGANTAVTATNTTTTTANSGATTTNTTTVTVNTGATNANTAATNVGILARARATASMVAMRVATLASAAATGVATVATRAWSMAMTANPIGLVIALIVALVAGLIYAWKNSETFRDVVTGAWQWIWDKISPIVNVLRVAIPAAFDFVRDKVVQAITWMRGQIVEKIAQVLAAKAKIEEFRDKVVGAITGMRDQAIAKVAGFVADVKALPGRILDGIGNLGSLLLDKGRDLVEGLWNGINNAKSWLIGKIKSFVTDAIPGPIADALGISSPSKVAAKLSRWVPRGMAGGMLDEIGVVRSASMKLAAAAVAGPMMLSVPSVPSLAGAAALPAGMAATVAADAGMAAPGTGADAGPLVEQHIHPREGQSEQAIGDASASSLAWALRSAGGTGR